MLNKLKNSVSVFNSKMNFIFQKFEISNPFFKKVLPTLLFLIFLHVFYTYIGIYKYLDKRPCSIHSSAQCQRASVALNYHENEMNFFKPMVQKDSVGQGVTGLEFPVIYYTGAVLYKAFGFNEVYLKGVSLFILTLGLLFFNLLVLRFIKNYIISIAIISAVICSPVLLYYTPNFMPDVPSFALVMSSWYFFFKYLQSNRSKDLNWFIFFATLAALIKSIALIGFIAIICLLVLDYLKFYKNKEHVYVFADRKKILKRVIGGILIVFAWYFYAAWLSKVNHNETFSLSPVIVDDMETANKVFEVIKNLWLYEYYPYETYVLICAIIVVLIISFKLVNRLLFSITLLYVLGCSFYVYFFFRQFMWHDYYIIAILPCVFFLFITFADLINTISEKYFSLTKFILFAVIFFNVKECLVWAEKAYNNRFSEYAINFNGNYKPYEDLEPKLRKLGIKRTEKVLIAYDISFCNGLYLSNQLGYSFDQGISKENLNQLMNNPRFKYLVVNDTMEFNKMYGKDISNKAISTHRSLVIYKLF